MCLLNRVGTLAVALATITAVTTASAQEQKAADLIVTNAKVHTMNPGAPEATAVAVDDGLFVAVGNDAAVEALRGPDTRVIDLEGRTVIPGLNDSHSHSVRAGRFYNLETRWDGVPTLAAALDLIRTEAERAPDGQWVRVIGGWSPYQFEERRMPTIKELNEAAPDTPTFVLFLYSQGFLNKAAVEALELTPETQAPPDSRYEFVDGGAILHAEPDPTILYQTIAKPPQLSEEDQVNSTLHFYRELNRLGMTSTVDAGGGGHVFPRDYVASKSIATNDGLPLRVTYYLSRRRPARKRRTSRNGSQTMRSARTKTPIWNMATSWVARASSWLTASAIGKTSWRLPQTWQSARQRVKIPRAICTASRPCWWRLAGRCASTRPTATASS